MTSNTYKVYKDETGSWLAVRRKELATLNLLTQISSASFQSDTGKTVYLDPAQDHALFVDAKKALGQEVAITQESVAKENLKSFIRTMPKFDASFSPRVVIRRKVTTAPVVETSVVQTADTAQELSADSVQ